MSKSTPKTKKESLPATETAVAGEVQAPVAVQEPEAPKKPAPKAPRKVASKATPEPVEVKVEETPAEVASVAAEPAVSAKAGKQGKARKAEPKKAKLVRDSFTFPESDYVLFAALKQRALGGGREIKKSELLRAGLNVLNAMPEEELLKVLDGVERIKTGRPSR